MVDGIGVKRKICVVITARPSYARIKTVLSAIQAHPDLELQIIGTASFLSNRFGSAHKVMERDGFKLNWEISTLFEADDLTSAPKATAVQITELSTAFKNLGPDVVVTIADRYETIATAIAATYMNITLAHVQGGEVTGNIDEKVRHAITKLADIHLVTNEDAQRRVIRMGEEEKTVYVTGCASIDLAKELKEAPEQYTFDPFAVYGGVGARFSLDEPYLVVMQHPLTTHFEMARQEMEETLKAVHAMDMPTYWFWPNPDSGTEGASEAIRAFRENYQPEKFAFFKNMEPHHFLGLIHQSACFIGNSSVGIRESAYLGVPVVNIGGRQAGRLRGKNVCDVRVEETTILQAIKAQVDHAQYGSENIYGQGNAGHKTAEVLAKAPLSFEKRITY